MKSKDIDNIKLFKEPGGKKKAGKVQEGVPCALLQEKTVDGEKWAKIDFCNRQGWCRMTDFDDLWRDMLFLCKGK